MNLVKTKSFEIAVYSKGKAESEKLALVLPGRLDTKDYPHMKSHVDFLAEKGFYALSFDPPGTWESKGDIKLYSMTNYLKAINELIEYFDNKPTFLVGHSRGGSMAMLAGTTNVKVVAFVSIMGSYSYRSGAKEYPNKEWKEKGYLLNKREIPGSDSFKEYKLPFSFYQDQTQYDMADGLKASKKPKMFIYGKEDILVTPKFVNEAFDLSSEPKIIHEVNSAHDYRFNPEIVSKVNEYLEEFINKFSIN